MRTTRSKAAEVGWAITRLARKPSTTTLTLFAAIILAQMPSTAYSKCDVSEAQLKGSYCYKYFSSSVTWAEADAACMLDRGWLATIADATENDYVSEMNPGYAWIGLVDVYRSGQWSWNGGPLQGQLIYTAAGAVSGMYTNWCKGRGCPRQPDHIGLQLYGVINFCTAGSGMWDNDFPTAKHPYVCQYYPSTPDPTAAPTSTFQPTFSPSKEPTTLPAPTIAPTREPTTSPTTAPTRLPTMQPSFSSSYYSPTTSLPSPSASPTAYVVTQAVSRSTLLTFAGIAFALALGVGVFVAVVIVGGRRLWMERLDEGHRRLMGADAAAEEYSYAMRSCTPVAVAVPSAPVATAADLDYAGGVELRDHFWA